MKSKTVYLLCSKYRCGDHCPADAADHVLHLPRPVPGDRHHEEYSYLIIFGETVPVKQKYRLNLTLHRGKGEDMNLSLWGGGCGEKICIQI